MDRLFGEFRGQYLWFGLLVLESGAQPLGQSLWHLTVKDWAQSFPQDSRPFSFIRLDPVHKLVTSIGSMLARQDFPKILNLTKKKTKRVFNFTPILCTGGKILCMAHFFGLPLGPSNAPLFGTLQKKFEGNQQCPFPTMPLQRPNQALHTSTCNFVQFSCQGTTGTTNKIINSFHKQFHTITQMYRALCSPLLPAQHRHRTSCSTEPQCHSSATFW